MTDRHINFRPYQVRAALDGSLSQTRRVLKPQPTMGDSDRDMLDMARYARGDLLWVREAFAISGIGWGKKPADALGGKVHFKADPDHGWQSYWGAWRSPIHMPRWASRLTLRVTDVRVQRVQDITLGDCWAEGCETARDLIGAHAIPKGAELPFKEFREMWDSIHSKARGTANGWKANPWVCALTFDVIRANVDQAGE